MRREELDISFWYFVSFNLQLFYNEKGGGRRTVERRVEGEEHWGEGSMVVSGIA